MTFVVRETASQPRPAVPPLLARASARLRPGLLLGLALLLPACTVEFLNTQPARDLAQAAQPPGAAAVGWRVFQQRCARCHGSDATGIAGAPDLLPRVRELGPRRFVNLVLRRYEWELPPPGAASEGPAREQLIDDLLQRKAGALVMPAWQGEPQVEAHVADLYAYLAARAGGSLGPGRPQP
jgi:cytochrome c5